MRFVVEAHANQHEECEHRDGRIGHMLRVVRVKEEVSDGESSKDPVVDRVLDNVSQRHCSMTEPMDKHGFVFSLAVMQKDKAQSDAIQK